MATNNAMLPLPVSISNRQSLTAMMMRLCILPMLVFWILGQTAYSQADTSARTPSEWLAAMAHAMHTADYRGLISYQQGQAEPASFRVLSGLLNGHQFERLKYLGGQPRERIRHDFDVTFVVQVGDPFLQSMDQYPLELFGPPFATMFGQLPNQYRAKLGTTTTWAGRKSVIVHVVPEDNYRYGYRLWLDTESAVLLRFEMLDPQQRNLETISFIEVDIGIPVTPEDMEVRINSGQIKLQMKIDETQSRPPPGLTTDWYATWLPMGFSVTTRDAERSFDGNGKPFQNLVYSDGLAIFSVYVESLRSDKIKGRMNRQGGTVTVVRRTADGTQRPHMVTVVGEVPEATALRVAQSMMHRGNHKPKTHPHPASSTDDTRLTPDSSPNSHPSDKKQMMPLIHPSSY